MSQTRHEWLKHALRQAPWRTQMQAGALVALGLIVSIIIGALYLAQATSTATAGRDLETLKQHLKGLEYDNDHLRAEIASYQTIPKLMQRAQEMGFAPASNDQITYLLIEGYRPPDPEPPVPIAEEPLPAYDETLNDWLTEQWASFLEQLNLHPGSEDEDS